MAARAALGLDQRIGSGARYQGSYWDVGNGTAVLDFDLRVLLVIRLLLLSRSRYHIVSILACLRARC